MWENEMYSEEIYRRADLWQTIEMWGERTGRQRGLGSIEFTHMVRGRRWHEIKKLIKFCCWSKLVFIVNAYVTPWSESQTEGLACVSFNRRITFHQHDENLFPHKNPNDEEDDLLFYINRPLIYLHHMFWTASPFSPTFHINFVHLKYFTRSGSHSLPDTGRKHSLDFTTHLVWSKSIAKS